MVEVGTLKMKLGIFLFGLTIVVVTSLDETLNRKGNGNHKA